MSDLDLRAQLSLSLGSGYIMDRELATAGRSRLFVARELTHDRDVVVKVLPEDIAAGVNPERFAREIHLISALQESHTVPILTTGRTANGVMYYTMPYIAEPSLGRRLEGAPVGFDDSVTALRDVARAMLHAHRQGIVHGDIKPESVFLIKGTAVITDFGVATALHVSRSDETERNRLRLVTSSVSAPGYVAPEHVMASPEADHRADIYAWGVMAYELLYDVHPFPYVNTVGELLEAHKSAPPMIPPHKAFGVPGQLATLVMRCLAKDPAERPANAAELLGVLDRIPSGAAALAVESWSPYRLIGMALLAFVVFLGLAGAIWRLRSIGSTEAPLVVVLPFATSGPVGDTVFANALMHGVSARLQQFAEIRIVDVASAHTLPGTSASAWDTGKSLGAQYVLQTNMRWFRDGDGSSHAQLSPVLLQVSDGKIKWVGTPQVVFPADPFTPQSSIATQVAQELGVAIGTSQKLILGARATSDSAAYAAFVRGDALYWQGAQLQPEIPEAALSQFERAFILDPRFADALGSWAAVAATHARGRSTPELLDSIDRTAQRALSIWPNHARALIAVGRVALIRNQLDDAFLAAFRAAGANPSVTEALLLQMDVQLLMGDSAAVWRDVERLVRIAPRSPNALAEVATAAIALRRFTDAREYLRRARALQPGRPDLVLRAAQLARQVGNISEMIRLVHEARTLGATLGPDDLALLRMGDEDMQAEFAKSSPGTYRAKSAADSFHYYMEKSKLLLAHRDSKLNATLDTAQAVLRNVLADRSTSAFDNRMFAESQGWIDAASGDPARMLAAMNDVPQSIKLQRYPDGAFAAFVACNDAEIFALGGDVERMLPRLERCLTLPGGYGTNAILGEPALSRHARDPRLVAMLGRIGLGLDRD